MSRGFARTIEIDKALIVAALVSLVSLGWVTGAPIFEPFGSGRLTAMTVLGFPVLLGILLLRRATGGPKALVGSWWPVFGILAVYESLKHMHANRITEWLGIRPKDELMLRLDEALFGKALPLWMDSWTAPWFQELMSFLYIWVYYLGPFTLLAIAYLRRRDDLFRRLRLGLVLGLLGGYVLYILVPVAGPLFLIGDRFEHPIPTHSRVETLVFDTLRFNWDCFPSLHTAIPWILTVLSWGRFPRWVSALSALLASGVTLSTVALRFHYGVDLLAAFAWVAVVCGAVAWLAKHDYGRFRFRLGAAPRRAGATRSPARTALGRLATGSALLAGAASVAAVAQGRWSEAWLVAPILAGAGVMVGTTLGLAAGSALSRRLVVGAAARFRLAAVACVGASAWMALQAAPSAELSIAAAAAATLARLGAGAAGPAGALVTALWAMPLAALVGFAICAAAGATRAFAPAGTARRLAAWSALGGASGLVLARAELVPRIGYGDTVLLGALAAAIAAWWFGRSDLEAIGARRDPAPVGRALRSRAAPLALHGVLFGALASLWLFLYPAAIGDSPRAFGTVATSILTAAAIALLPRTRPGPRRSGAAARLYACALLVALLAPLWGRAPVWIAAAAADVETLVAIERIRFVALLVLVLVPALALALSLRRRIDEARGADARPSTALLLGSAVGAIAVALALVVGAGAQRALAVTTFVAAAAGAVALLRPRPRGRVALAVVVSAPALLAALAEWDTRPLAAGAHLDLGRRRAAGTSVSVPTEDAIAGFVARFEARRDWTAHALVVAGSGLVHAALPDPVSAAAAALAREHVRTPGDAVVLGASPAAARALSELGMERVELVASSEAILAATLAAEGGGATDRSVRFETTLGSERGRLATGGPYDVVLSKLDDFWLGLARGAVHREFYALVRSRLAPGGVFVQALSLDSVGVKEVGAIVASLARELPFVSLRVVGRHLILLATAEPQAETPEPAAAGLMRPWQVERWLAFAAPEESSDRAGTLDFVVPNYRVAGDISAATSASLVTLMTGRVAPVPVAPAGGAGSAVQRPATHQPPSASSSPG